MNNSGKLSLDCLDQIRYLTGYAGGIEKKEKLLEIEGIYGAPVRCS